MNSNSSDELFIHIARSCDKLVHLDLHRHKSLESFVASLTFVASWNPIVFLDDFLVIFPAAAEFEDAVVGGGCVQRCLVSLDSAVFEHVEVVVTSFSFVVELRNSEEVGVTFTGDWFQFCWWCYDLEHGRWDEVDSLVALRDLVQWIVGGFIPAATADSNTLELRNTWETAVMSDVEKSLELVVRDGGSWESRGNIVHTSGVHDRVQLKSVSEKSRAFRWWCKGGVKLVFFVSEQLVNNDKVSNRSISDVLGSYCGASFVREFVDGVRIHTLVDA